MKSGVSKSLLPWVAAVLVVAVWAETFVSTKVLIFNGLAPASIFFYRFLVAYILIWPLSHERVFARSIRDEALLAVLGLTGGSLYFLAENTALAYSTASNVSILVGTAPLMTALLLSSVHREERMGPRQIAGSVLAFIGMCIVVLNGELVLELNPLGDALALGAALVWAVYSLVVKEVLGKYNVWFITRKILFYGILTISVYFVTVEPLHFDTDILFRPVVWGNLLFLGLVASLLCYLAWNWALGRLGTVRTTNLIYCQCFFTMLIAHFVLGEEIAWVDVIGSLILIVGTINALWKKKL